MRNPAGGSTPRADKRWYGPLGVAVAVVCAAGAIGCAGIVDAGGGQAARGAQRARGAAPATRFVEHDAPFIVDWDPRQVASLAAAIRGPNIGAVVVSYRRGTIRLLPECWISGIYSPFAIGMYTGALQMHGGDHAEEGEGTRFEALQQVSTSGRMGQGTVMDYRFVLIGRHDVSGSRASAGLLELKERAPDGCRGATHFVRAVGTGAFERLGDASTPGIPWTEQGVGAGQGQQALPAQGGDVGACVMSNNAADPACSALVKIERFAAFRPAVVALRLTAFAVNGRPSPNLRFRLRGKDGWAQETPAFTAASSFANLLFPAVEITEEVPLVIEALDLSARGAPAVIGSGQVTPSTLRQGVINRGVFNVELGGAGGATGTVQLAIVPQ